MRFLVGITAVLAAGCGRVAFTSHDAALGDSREADASDAPVDAAPVCSGQFACDLLDGPTLDSLYWNDSGGMLSFDTAIKHRGAGSLRMRIPATPAGSQVSAYIAHVGPDVQALGPDVWLRAWFRMSALPTATNALELMSMQQTSGAGIFVFARSFDTELYHQYDAANGDAGGVPPPVNQWFCLLWHITLATTSTGGSQLTSDVVPSATITGSVTQGTPAMDGVGFGPFFSSTNLDVMQPSFDVWLDDVIVDDAPINCTD